MNSSSDLSTNNHNSSASILQQETPETASRIPATDDQFAILQSQNDEHAKKVTELDKTLFELDKTLFESGKQILKLHGKMKELDEKFTNSEKEFKETLNKKITDQQAQIISLCGIFISILTFISVNVQIFTKADNLYQALVFMVIFFILTAGIILISHRLLTQVYDWHVIGMLSTITVIAIALICLAQKDLNSIKLISKQELTPPPPTTDRSPVNEHKKLQLKGS
jgi:uncharacterized coiled-coil protein SlyX